MQDRRNTIPEGMFQLWGTVSEVGAGRIVIKGLYHHAGIGNEIAIRKDEEIVRGEIMSVSTDSAQALLFSNGSTVRIGDVVHVEQSATAEIGDHWLGQIVNYRGEVNTPTVVGHRHATRIRALTAPPLPAHARRPLGPRIDTGLMATDTLLPLCKGQRVGLFAGSGVGKSTLLGALAQGVNADRVVVALIGERSREVNAFANEVLTPEMAEKTVIVAATASEPAGAKKRAALCAMAAAEHFRDEGHDVLLIVDSITRFAEAHRETALMAGEAPALNAFPPSTVRVISELVERSGTGVEGTGDITAIYSVLVAGSDMEEPVADMIRGILDGHIILSRNIAERGRYPAIDVLRSVSRALPNAATADENEVLKEFRRLLALHGEVEPMVRANLFEFGHDANADRAIKLFPALDAFIGTYNTAHISDAFDAMRLALSGGAASDIPANVAQKPQ